MQDAIRFIPAAELRPVPWKNDGGTTRQIAIFPDDAGPDDFIWRISAADVAIAGPFSYWEDIDRILILTRGGPLRLTRTDTGQDTLLETGARLYFAGETILHCVQGQYQADLPARLGGSRTLLEQLVLSFQLLQACHHRGIHAAKLGTPLVERGAAHAVLSAQLGDGGVIIPLNRSEVE